MSAARLLLIALVVCSMHALVSSAPFFDAIYDAVVGNGRRSYGYGGYGYGSYSQNGYGSYPQNGYNYPSGHRRAQVERQGKSYKDLCRVHYPDAALVPGTGGIVCPF